MTATKRKQKNRIALWAATAEGYVVQIFAGGRVIHEYTAGNHANDSQGFISPDSPNALPLATMRKFAKQTAAMLADEYGAASVSEDSDLETSVREL